MGRSVIVRTRIARRTAVLAALLPAATLFVVAGPLGPARAASSISYVTRSCNSNETADHLKLDTPGSLQSDDVMLAGIYTRGKPSVTTPAGWTFIRHNGKGRLYYRVVDGSENASYTWTFNMTKNAGGCIVVYRGVDPFNPINTDTGKRKSKSKTINAPSATTTTDGVTLVAFYGILADTHITPPNNFTERLDKRTKGTENRITWEVSDKHQSTAGRTGDKKATAGKKKSNVGQLVALNADDSGSGGGGGGGVYRAFTDTSYWNTPLPASAPIDPNSANIMGFIQRDSTTNYVQLSGTGSSGDWGQPIYWAQPSDPVYDVQATHYTIPPEFGSLRIPRNAKTDDTSDHPMTIFDLTAGYVAWLWEAVYDARTDTWSAGGGSVHYLDSNGLDGDWTQYQDSDPRNTGHRGVAGAVFPVRYDEIDAGVISHVLKIGINRTKCDHVFPMVGDECGTTDPNAPPEGTRIRIKPSVNLSQFGLSPSALVIAQALQQYGAIIGDQSGGQVSMKVENVVTEGRGWLWDGLLSSTSLSAIPLNDFEVIQLGYAPPG